jgi:uncharacterized protein
MADGILGRGWAFPVRPAPQGDVGMVAAEEDVRESIVLILETERGERVMRPDFGAGLRDFVFDPITTTTLALVRSRVEESLVAWEPRIDVDAVRVSDAEAAAGRLLISVDYRVRSTNSFYNLVWPFYVREART